MSVEDLIGLHTRLEVHYIVTGYRAQIVTELEKVTHEGDGETVLEAIAALKEGRVYER